MLTPRLERLLDAGLAAGPASRAAWLELAATELTPSERRLLPLVARNLGPTDPALPGGAMLAAASRDAFLGNAAIVGHALPLIRALGAHGVRVAILKGAALAPAVYGDWGGRVISDVDILVERPAVATAFAVLLDAGFRPAPGGLDEMRRHLRTEHGHNFASPAGGRVDLHWSPLRACPVRALDDDHWAHAGAARLEGLDVLRLAPADEVFLACVHAAHDRVHKALVCGQWVADVVLLVRAHGERLDWQRVADLARTRGFARTVGDALAWLARRFGAAVPASILASLASARVTLAERVERAAVHARGPAREILSDLARFRRMRAAPRYRAPGRGLVRFLADGWGLTRLSAVPPVFVGHLARKLVGLDPPPPRREATFAARRKPTPAAGAPTAIVVTAAPRREERAAIRERLAAVLARAGGAGDTIFVVERDEREPGAATARNVGAAFALARGPEFDHFVFHDLDAPVEIDTVVPAENAVELLPAGGVKVRRDDFIRANGFGAGADDWLATHAELAWRVRTSAELRAPAEIAESDAPGQLWQKLDRLPGSIARGYIALFGLDQIDADQIRAERVASRVWFLEWRHREVVLP